MSDTLGDAPTEPLPLLHPDRPWSALLSGLALLAVVVLGAAVLIFALDDIGAVPTSQPSAGGAPTATWPTGHDGHR